PLRLGLRISGVGAARRGDPGLAAVARDDAHRQRHTAGLEQGEFAVVIAWAHAVGMDRDEGADAGVEVGEGGVVAHGGSASPLNSMSPVAAARRPTPRAFA